MPIHSPPGMFAVLQCSGGPSGHYQLTLPSGVTLDFYNPHAMFADAGIRGRLNEV